MISGAALGLILTVSQVKCLNLAYIYGEPYGLGRTFKSVVLVESSGCVNESGDDGRSIGPAQIQMGTASKVCGCIPDAARLQTDKEYNLRLGAQFLASCFNKFWPDKRRATLCYNVGPFVAAKASSSQVKNSRYVRKVLEAERALENMRQDHD